MAAYFVRGIHEAVQRLGEWRLGYARPSAAVRVERSALFVGSRLVKDREAAARHSRSPPVGRERPSHEFEVSARSMRQTLWMLRFCALLTSVTLATPAQALQDWVGNLDARPSINNPPEVRGYPIKVGRHGHTYFYRAKEKKAPLVIWLFGYGPTTSSTSRPHGWYPDSTTPDSLGCQLVTTAPTAPLSGRSSKMSSPD